MNKTISERIVLTRIINYLETVILHIVFNVNVCAQGSPQYFDALDGELIESKIMCNVLKAWVILQKTLALSYTCLAVVLLARNIVLPRLKSRLPSSLKTGFAAAMSFKAWESRPIILPSSAKANPRRAGNILKTRPQRCSVTWQKTMNSGGSPCNPPVLHFT